MAIVVPGIKPKKGPGSFPRHMLPEEEHEAASHIERLLSLLATYEVRFLAALSLFDKSEEEMSKLFGLLAHRREVGDPRSISPEFATVTEWMAMAARDGAITIYHFGNTIEAIRKALPNCPTMNARVEHSILRGASRFFRTEFPRYEAIRHVISHAADFAATPASIAAHSHRGGPIKFNRGGSLEISGKASRYYSDNLMNRTYYVSYEGEAHSYEIDQKTADKLLLAKLRVYSSLVARGHLTSTPAS
ncbi:MAG: hypothetical protein QOH32_1449 [Bradyrhizobium sp.]|jgi:hypothetical protein|nr:hypothetical protein [Bradyrhizobium sp.]